MNIRAIKTRIFVPPKDNLFDALQEALPRLKEKTILAVTSKVVSIGEGRCIPVSDVPDKDALIAAEADNFLPRSSKSPWAVLTLKQNLFVVSAGIDESNSGGHYILWPKDPQRSAKRMRRWMQKTYGIRECGVIITDSRSMPLRRGSIGFCLGYAGFRPLNDFRGQNDLFGRALKITQVNVADALSASAVFAMGETREQTPAAVITEIPFVEFSNLRQSKKPHSSFEIQKKEDIYYPLLGSVAWKKGGGGARLP